MKTAGQHEYEAGREAAIKAAQNMANACNLANIYPCDIAEVVRLREESRELRAKAARMGFDGGRIE